MQQKRDTYKLEEWWHNHFFHKFSHFVILSHVSQFFTSLSYLWPSFFKGSCIFFLAFNALSMARPRWRSLWRCWMTISEPSGPGRPGKPQTMQDCSLEALTVFFKWFSYVFLDFLLALLRQRLSCSSQSRPIGSLDHGRKWMDSCSAWQRQVNAYESQLKLEEVATITVGRPKEKGLWRRLVRGKPPESYSIKANSCCDGKLKPWIKDDERM